MSEPQILLAIGLVLGLASGWIAGQMFQAWGMIEKGEDGVIEELAANQDEIAKLLKERSDLRREITRLKREAGKET